MSSKTKQTGIEYRANIESRLLIIEQLSKEIYTKHYLNTSYNDIEGEVWLEIKGSNGVYWISNFERVKSVDRFIEFIRRGSMVRVFQKGKIIKHVFDASVGYRYLNLASPVKRKGVIHRLMAEHFIPNPNNLPLVNHINGDGNDNRLKNLEWADKSINYIHAIDIIGIKTNIPPSGINSKFSKKVVQLDLSGSLIKIWDSQADVQRQLKISQSGVSAVCRGVSEHAGGYKWMFKNDYDANKI